MRIQFLAQIMEIKSKSLVSLDKSIRILLETDNRDTSELIRLDADQLVRVTIEEEKEIDESRRDKSALDKSKDREYTETSTDIDVDIQGKSSKDST